MTSTETSTPSAPTPAPPRPAHQGRARAQRWAAGRARTVRATVQERRDDGMATAEYAIATIAAVGFAGLLIAVLKSEAVKGLLSGLISSALSIG